MLDIGKVHEVNCWLCAILGIFFNSLLIWMIVYRSVAEIRPYSRILLQTCVIDIYTVVTMIVVQPVFVIVSGWNVLYENGSARFLPLPYNVILFLLWHFGYYFSIVSNALQFLYRYLILCREMKISALRYLLMLLTASIPVFVYLWILYNVTYPDPSRPIASLTAQIFSDINESVEIMMLAYSNTLSVYLFCLYTGTFNVACYAVIIICGIKIRKFIVRAAQEQQLSSRAVMYNRQISVTLALQAILPCVGSSISMMAVLASAMVGKASSVYIMPFVILPIHWITVLNPVITIITMGSYRRVVFRSKRIATTKVNIATVRSATVPLQQSERNHCSDINIRQNG
ncbi:serpentine type 7TM GPCR chemoreceptor srd domain-containing protein [Ditylenchus destructor]|uniref:Serpentine type 7TM GPCR chemoreceptor srd domain-containing protein n=1 Tax=Ditylenchus destructor TaxID=166010 RepID=A0AAD4MTY5_9BILA|nr:serpentine type 7TM GPCR chemoreceptor srd domain-containing protein [Ditylenchus destructor]